MTTMTWVWLSVGVVLGALGLIAGAAVWLWIQVTRRSW